MNDFAHFVKHLKFEALALAVLMIVLTHESEYSKWWLIIAFPLFDIGMIGYARNTRLGALTYNQCFTQPHCTYTCNCRWCFF